ncbi:unnamed protein product [Mytilus coruscus]|uniref:ubiquitinyl hydrolase 1 n=1 Tax=Mytilus coruscus TaxID=42192 RepID=A0A6J8C8Z4_MYTCO|nr:unnamed protein product [Mytilus coruscus]
MTVVLELQTLAWCPKLQAELETIEVELNESCKMTKSILRLLKYTYSKEPIDFKPLEVQEAAGERDSKFYKNDQQDSFEIFNTIIDAMKVEIMELYEVECVFQRFSNLTVPTITVDKNVTENDEIIRRESVQRLAFETMGNVDANTTDVEKCLIHGMMQIEEDLMSCKKCDLLGVAGICYKKMMIFETPAILVLHIDRFRKVTGKVDYNDFDLFLDIKSEHKNREVERTKHDDLVTYPETLKIEPLCSIALKETDADKQLSYNLFGVVAHSGSLDCGHYVTYIKTTQQSSGDWYEQFCKQSCLDDPEQYKDKIERILEEHKENAQCFQTGSSDYKNNDNGLINTEPLNESPEMKMMDKPMWYLINDATVKACKREEAIDNKNAYILFYVKT